MQLIDGQPVYAATDLVGFLACGHLTDLERCALAGLTRRPERLDPELDRIRKRGYEHEQRYKSDLAARGRQVTDLDEPHDEPWTADKGTRLRLRAQQTVEAIRRGDDVIFQACFFDGTWLGFADFLLRVETAHAHAGLVVRGRGHQAGAQREGLGRPAALLLQRAAGSHPGSRTGVDARRARRQRPGGRSLPLREVRGLLPHREAALPGDGRRPPPRRVPAAGALLPGPRGALRGLPLVAGLQRSPARG